MCPRNMRQARFTLGGGSGSRSLRLTGTVLALLVVEQKADMSRQCAAMARGLSGKRGLLAGRQADGEIFAFQVVWYFAHNPVIAMLTQQDDSR